MTAEPELELPAVGGHIAALDLVGRGGRTPQEAVAGREPETDTTSVSEDRRWHDRCQVRVTRGHSTIADEAPVLWSW
jgi:hypothetical protein